MKRFLQLAFALAALLSPWRGLGQGFVNLNFEAPAQYGTPDFGWTASSLVEGVTYQQTFLSSNTMALSAANIGLIDRRFPSPSAVFFFPQFLAPFPDYGHSVLMQAGIFGFREGGGFPYGGEWSLAQTALVPSGTESLRFVTQLNAQHFGVFMNGIPLTLFPLSSTTNATTWVADIHSWANEQAELRFTVTGQNPYVSASHNLVLDNIQFSTVAVPEPSTWALLGLGTLFFAHALRRRNR